MRGDHPTPGISSDNLTFSFLCDIVGIINNNAIFYVCFNTSYETSYLQVVARNLSVIIGM